MINIYEIEDDFLSNEELSIKNFGTEVSNEWATFVMNNRNKRFRDVKDEACNLDCKYDIVIGPVANDDLATLFREYRRHMITQQTFLSELTYKKVTNQISFHTERAIRLLQKRGVIA